LRPGRETASGFLRAFVKKLLGDQKRVYEEIEARVPAVACRLPTERRFAKLKALLREAADPP